MPTPDRVDHRVVILGAGRDVRTAVPPALVPTPHTGRVLDWLLEAFGALAHPEVYFVGGYMADRVLGTYPGLRVVLNPAWDRTGPAHSLALAPLRSERATWVSYSDIVFRPSCVARMDAADGDVVLAVDQAWRHRYAARAEADLAAAEKVRLDGARLVDLGAHIPTPAADAELLGLVRLSPPAVTALEDILADGLDANTTLPDVLRHLTTTDLRLQLVDVAGDWAELNAPQDLARFVLGTKAESLERLRPLLRTAEIADLVSIEERAWREDPTVVLDQIRETLATASVIVRSSARVEDGWTASHAGTFRSIPDVPVGDHAQLGRAIEDVLASYGADRVDEQVLVQPMLTDVALSGVVMTRTPGTGGPYYVVSFDDRSSRTDRVTAGTSGDIRTVHLLRDCSEGTVPEPLVPVLHAVREIEALVGHDSLDIEFAVTRDGKPYVLQVRPMTIAPTVAAVDDDAVRAGIEEATRRLDGSVTRHPSLLGSRTLYSVMTDWNPAEMIGTTPSRLALSLYQWLVTDEAWATSRAELGYRDVRPCPLLVDVLGHPYVDVRADFTSFVPASLSDDVAERLVEHYLDRLAARPELHDKVEFEILHTCASVDPAAERAALAAAGFAPDEAATIVAALRDVTRRTIERPEADRRALEQFGARFDRTMAASLPPLDRAFTLLDDARRLGYPVFANLARAGFAATSLLRSLEAVGAITAEEREGFLASLETVSGRLQRDGARVADGTLAWTDFVAAYGHLRPGTYDVTSPCYASDPDTFLAPIVDRKRRSEGRSDFRWAPATRDRIDAALAAAELGVRVDQLTDFCRTAIVGREEGKFVVTRNVSAALEALAAVGQQAGLARGDLTHVRIGDLLALHDEVRPDPSGHLRMLARDGREAALLTHAVALPPQIVDLSDLYGFEAPRAEPNFVTRRSVTGPVVVLGGDTADAGALPGAIVVVPCADPGFDWLFSHDIAGLVTMYGGSNSHMAIRAQEFRLPAAIGVGPVLYEQLASAGVLELDCAARRVRVVH